MILNLFNIVSKCIGNIWWNMGMHHNGIGCGMMVSHLNSRITSLGILCQGILTWLEVVEWFGVYLVMAMVKVLMMGYGLWWRGFFWREQLNVEGVKLENVKTVVAFLRDKLSNQPKSSYSGSWRPLQRIFWHVRAEDVDRRSPILSMIPSKGPWKSTQFVQWTRTTSPKYLLKNWPIFMNIAWTVTGLITLMSIGQANGCQRFCNPKILNICEIPCMKVGMEIGNMQ